ncbi:histidine kinase [Streptomyces sp. B6B3]|uniref:histidine kinase n=1 Tax=Streptomyces sp. B6B3 TaxID=3153570 RepID=UPI00325EA44A
MRGLGRLVRFRHVSQRARVELCTRWAIYSFTLIEALVIAMVLGNTASESTGWALAVVGATCAAHVALNLWLTQVGLRYYLAAGRDDDEFPPVLGRRGGAVGTAADRPDRLIAALTGTTLAGVVAVVALAGGGRLPDDTMVVGSYLVVYSTGTLPLVATARQTAGLLALPTAAGLAGAALAGVPAVRLGATLAVGVGASLLLGAACRLSAWTLRVIDKLDAARETEARLAVAEERLRFGRDLHDVLGRNLSVIALKSELAGQLAQRGSPAAVDQMVEVQRIARESQREMREVVRGYRRAQLHGELAGARGVLEAAGIRCRIEDGDSAALPEPVQSALGWVVREGTTNMLRHAQPNHCTVRLRRAPGGLVVLDMENDGAPPLAAGPLAAAGPGEGSGLAGLRERVTALGGSLTVERGPGDTFRLRAALPASGGRTTVAGTDGTSRTAGRRRMPGTAEPDETAETGQGPGMAEPDAAAGADQTASTDATDETARTAGGQEPGTAGPDEADETGEGPGAAGPDGTGSTDGMGRMGGLDQVERTDGPGAAGAGRGGAGRE